MKDGRQRITSNILLVLGFDYYGPAVAARLSKGKEDKEEKNEAEA